MIAVAVDGYKVSMKNGKTKITFLLALMRKDEYEFRGNLELVSFLVITLRLLFQPNYRFYTQSHSSAVKIIFYFVYFFAYISMTNNLNACMVYRNIKSIVTKPIKCNNV